MLCEYVVCVWCMSMYMCVQVCMYVYECACACVHAYVFCMQAKHLSRPNN